MTSTSPDSTVRLDPHPADERLAILRLGRPPVNALDQAMWDRLAIVAQELHESATYRAVVITGGDQHFAAGADIKELLALTVEQFDRRNRVLQQAFHTLAQAPQIVIAAVNGYALGGGCELALAADFRIAGHRTVVGLPEITLGIMPGSGGTQRLARLVGPGRAKDLILSGRHVSSEEALRIGLVDRLVGDAEVFDAAVEQGLTYARGPLALRHAKHAIDAGLDRPIDAGLALEADLITACFESEDGQHGLRAFVTRNPPIFRGR